MTYTRKQLIDEAKDQLKTFIDSDARAAWLYCFVGDIFVRKNSVHSLHGVTRDTFDVANIKIDLQYRGIAIMHELLEWINTAHHNDFTYIECVHNVGFAESLLEHGWFDAGYAYETCLYRKRSTFDPTVFTFEVTDTGVVGDAGRYIGRILEYPQFQIYEHSERHVRREMFRFLEEIGLELPGTKND